MCGQTGAGKSTYLNALLHGSNILPTSGLHACTAGVVEARYHNFQKGVHNPAYKYKAEISFIGKWFYFSMSLCRIY